MLLITLKDESSSRDLGKVGGSIALARASSRSRPNVLGPNMYNVQLPK
jgi:hypothetical protein